MADIQFYQEESEDAQDQGDLTPKQLDTSDNCSFEDELSALQKLEQYLNSDSVYSRQIVVRSLLETVQSVGDSSEDAAKVLAAMTQLSEDSEPLVRAELMEQIPQFTLFCYQNPHLFDNPICTHILPIVIKYLTDCNNQVRKTSQDTLRFLLEHELLNKDDVETQVCPVIMELADPNSFDDFRKEGVVLMSKVAPLVGRETTQRVFLPRFADMCTDGLFSVRKECATNFGDLCIIVGQHSTETLLLSRFCYLCEDGVWGVRKACAECFKQVSDTCSPDIRHTELARVFISLICDQSRWVRIAAFQALGGFISTFADPTTTGLYFNEDGTLVVGNAEQFAESRKCISEEAVYEITSAANSESTQTETSSVCHPNTTPANCDTSPVAMDTRDDDSVAWRGDSGDAGGCRLNYDDDTPSVEQKRAEVAYRMQEDRGITMTTHHDTESRRTQSDNSDDSTTDVGSDPSSSPLTCTCIPPPHTVHSEHVEHLTQSESSYNSFQFWRTPLPSVHPLTPPPPSKEPDGDPVYVLTTRVAETDLDDDDYDVPVIHTAALETAPAAMSETVANIGSTHVLGKHLSETTLTVVDGVVHDLSESTLMYSLTADQGSETEQVFMETRIPDQDVIPQVLLDHYLSMTDPSRAQMVDPDMAKHCAYSLPAVAYTLGRKHWPCLKELYETLASDMQWKVRRTLAFSIHQLGAIVGEEITGSDLVPVFNGFLRDLDEVRIGLLKHLADFLRILKPEMRQEYLTKMSDFLSTDNSRNWRFREELAEQLSQLVELFNASDVFEHLLPLVLTLVEDRVAAVRISTYKVLSSVVRKLSEDDTEDGRKMLDAVLTSLTTRFLSLDCRACQRQMYVKVCGCILKSDALPPDEFSRRLLPHLLILASDRVVTVRICVARVLSKHVLSSDYLMSDHNPHLAALHAAVERLQVDSDRDVVYFINHKHTAASQSVDIPHTQMEAVCP